MPKTKAPARRPGFDKKLRQRARAAYKSEGSYRKAAAKLGLSVKRTYELVNDERK